MSWHVFRLGIYGYWLPSGPDYANAATAKAHAVNQGRSATNGGTWRVTDGAETYETTLRANCGRTTWRKQ